MANGLGLMTILAKMRQKNQRKRRLASQTLKSALKTTMHYRQKLSVTVRSVAPGAGVRLDAGRQGPPLHSSKPVNLKVTMKPRGVSQQRIR
jgi:hypothetical protein